MPPKCFPSAQVLMMCGCQKINSSITIHDKYDDISKPLYCVAIDSLILQLIYETMITLISATNRKDSVSMQITTIYQALLKEQGVESEIIDLHDLPADFIVTALYDKAGKNEVFNTFRLKMKAAQKMVFIVPEYNGSFPGVLKAFIDGLIFPHTFTDKKCALVGISSGIQGGGLAISHLTDIFNYCGMNVLALKPKLSRIEENLTENKLSKLYETLLREQIVKLLLF